jgi:hypothetical protein
MVRHASTMFTATAVMKRTRVHIAGLPFFPYVSFLVLRVSAQLFVLSVGFLCFRDEDAQKSRSSGVLYRGIGSGLLCSGLLNDLR